MRKEVILSLIILFSLSSCNENVQSDNSELSIQNEDSTVDSTIAFSASNYDEDDNLTLKVAQKILSFDSYQKETIGKTVAKSIFSYTQNITSHEKKYDGFIECHNKSNSTFVKTNNTTIYHNDLVLYKTKKDKDYSLYNLDDYLDNHGGLNPHILSIEGYDVTKGVISTTLVEETDDYKMYTISLDGNESGYYNKIQMKELGNLKDYPTFEELTIDLYIKDDYTPIKTLLHAKYNIDVAILGKTSCIQELESSYSNINGIIDMDNLASYKAYNWKIIETL